MDRVDKMLLDLIQRGFPVAERPYLILAAYAGIGEEEALERIEVLKREKIIRRIGGIFDSEKLGYVSTLCAAKVPEDQIERLSEFIKPITEITHNYQRDHAYNVWFTVIAASESRMDQVIQSVRGFLNGAEVYSLPASRKYKVNVFFSMTGHAGGPHSEPMSDADASDTVQELPVLREAEKAMIRLLQESLPSGTRPFRTFAERLGMEESQLLEGIEMLQKNGAMKRFGSILYHQKAGYGANAMGVWQVPGDELDETGARMASNEKVSHCYARAPIPGFGYNLFTMVHGRSDEECREVMAALSRDTGRAEYHMLFSIRELKKSSMKYFTETEC